jgi:hypothetical protein
MATAPNAPGGAGADQTGGAGGSSGSSQDNQNPPPGGTGDKGPVPWADHQRALGDLHKFKSKNQENEARLSELTATVESLQTKISTGAKDFESLHKTEKEKREAAEAETKRLKQNVIYAERHRAVYPALKKAGLRDDAENLLDVMNLDEIEVEATTAGRFIVNGVDAWVEGAKAKYPYAFQKPGTPVVNGSSGNGAPPGQEKWSPGRLWALEVECRKKGDLKPWEQAVKEWKAQGRPA